MKLVLLLGLLVATFVAHGDSLPTITSQPANQNISLNGTANFSVAATGAIGFQWRHNGTDLPGATNATLQVTNVQTADAGYYLVVVKNGTGWAPSKLVYLSAGNAISGGSVPLSNYGIPSAQAKYSFNTSFGGAPITNGTVQIVAGPQLDQMSPIGDTSLMFMPGYFDDFDQIVPTVLPGDTVYYRVDVTYPYNGGSRTQPSTVLKLTAGGDSHPVPDASNLKFPVWIEWPADPFLQAATATNQIRVPGETVSLTNDFYCFGDYGVATGQWRKDGVLLPNGTNFFQVPPIVAVGYGTFRAILTISNVQPSDAGVYDVQVLGNNWIIGPKTSLSVQIANIGGAFSTPRSDGSNFLADLQGIQGRNYIIQWSSNLFDWNNLQTVSNATGTISITNATSDKTRFYRSVLLP